MKTALLILLTAFSLTAFAHSGGTDKHGCHKSKATNTRHCHK